MGSFLQDWVLLFWMPYDNDLGPNARPVLEQIRAGITGARVEAAVQLDLPGDGGMVRTRFGRNVRTVELAGEDSSSAEELGRFLEWASRTFEARRYALVVLGHGGSIGEISLDRWPAEREEAWMDVADLAAEAERFDDLEAGAIELLFLQSCARATLETAWELRHSARTLLASQALLGAPNFYYEAVLHELAESPSMSGLDLARVIALSDRADMFVSYTAIDTGALDDLPALIDSAAAECGGSLRWSDVEASLYHYAGDSYMDAQLLISLACSASPVSDHASVELSDRLRQVVSGYWTSPAPPDRLAWILPDAARPSGLSLWVPLTKERESRLDFARHGGLTRLTAIGDLPERWGSDLVR